MRSRERIDEMTYWCFATTERLTTGSHMELDNENDWGRLLKLAQDGDKAAFGRFAISAQNRLSCFLFSLAGDAHFAEDAFQATMVAVLVNLHAFDPSRNATGWVFQIARNMVYTMNRRKAAQSSTLPLHEIADLASEEPQPSETQEKAEDAATMWALLGRLPDAQQIVIRLRVVLEMKYEKIAETLDLPLGTVSTHFNRGVASLRRMLEDEGYGTFSK